MWLSFLSFAFNRQNKAVLLWSPAPEFVRFLSALRWWCSSEVQNTNGCGGSRDHIKRGSQMLRAHGGVDISGFVFCPLQHKAKTEAEFSHAVLSSEQRHISTAQLKMSKEAINSSSPHEVHLGNQGPLPSDSSGTWLTLPVSGQGDAFWYLLMSVLGGINHSLSPWNGFSLIRYGNEGLWSHGQLSTYVSVCAFLHICPSSSNFWIH